MKKILCLTPVLCALFLLLGTEPVDLGLITDRRGFVLTPTGRTDLLRFDVTAYPSIMSNTIVFHLTNRLVQAADLPLPNGPGLIAIQTMWKDGSYSQPALYTYDLYRGVTDGPLAKPVGIIVPNVSVLDPSNVVERAVALALRPPIVTLPPLPPMADLVRTREDLEQKAATPLPDAAPEEMRHYYQRARRDGTAAVTNAPRSRIRRFR